MSPDRPQRQRFRGCSSVALTGAFWVLIGFDVVLILLNDAPTWSVIAPLAAGAAAALSPRRWPRISTIWRVGIGAGVSGLITLLLICFRIERTLFGPGEIVALVWFIVIAVRSLSTRWAIAMGALAVASLTALPARLSSPGDVQPGAPIALGLLAAIVVVVAMRLRAADQTHRLELLAARRSERLAMAADLHDYVGHHLVELLMQVQMGRMQMAAGQVDGDHVLASAERAAVDALDAVRRAVGALRDSDDVTLASTAPTMGPSALREVVASFQRTHRGTTTLAQHVEIGGLPPDVQAALHRVLTESLTNAHRHASPDATVDIVVEERRGAIGLSVRNDGVGRSLSPAAVRTGRVGLLGLDERVRSLSGSFQAGPVDDESWLVDVTLPLSDRAGALR